MFIILLGLWGGAFLLSAASSQLVSVKEALKKVFLAATIFEKEEFCLLPSEIVHIQGKADLLFKDAHSARVTRYVVKQDEQVLGYGFEDIVHGKWGPIHYLVALDLNGVVLGIVILDYQEIRGKLIAKKRFLKQYIGKTIDNPLRLRKDIDGITGATISSRSLTDGVRKILHIYHEFKAAPARMDCEKP